MFPTNRSLSTQYYDGPNPRRSMPMMSSALSTSPQPQPPPPEAGPVPNSQQPHSAQPYPLVQQPLPLSVPELKPKTPIPDIMDADDTLLALSAPVSTPPPIPPNPEKDLLLHKLASTLYSMRISSRHTVSSSLAGLNAQKLAMGDARMTILSELQNLTLISQMLQHNTHILHETQRQADRVVAQARAQPEPDIDQLLVPPNVVSAQLYSLVAEERACGDAIFALVRGVEKGRVTASTFAKLTRGLGREWFAKKALIQKVARGIGLAGH